MNLKDFNFIDYPVYFFGGRSPPKSGGPLPISLGVKNGSKEKDNLYSTCTNILGSTSFTERTFYNIWGTSEYHPSYHERYRNNFHSNGC